MIAGRWVISRIRLAGAVVLGVMLLFSCTDVPKGDVQGYVEGDYLYVAAPLAGQLTSLAVDRGDRVETGAALFTLERSREAAAVAEAESQLQQATSRLADLAKGERPSELAALESRLDQAKVVRELAQRELLRRESLFRDKVIAAEELDQARSTAERTAAAAEELTAQLQTARLGGRSDALAAERATVTAARERLEQARWSYTQKAQAAPAAALVYDTLYTVGEYVPAGYPVVSLLPPGQVKLRFFVPEPLLGRLAVGQQVRFSFDGAPRSYPAGIVFISPQAEYTPPVIYSRQERSKLVYLVEARPAPEIASGLHPGQPVDIVLEAP